MINRFQKIKLTTNFFEKKEFYRVQYLENLLNEKKIDKNLNWIEKT